MGPLDPHPRPARARRGRRGRQPGRGGRRRQALDARAQARHPRLPGRLHAPRSPRRWPRPTTRCGSCPGRPSGYYGDRGDEELTEASPPGTGFLSDVVLAWEAATQPAVDAGASVALLRTGIVLAREGGAMKPLLRLGRFGLGGPLGSGRQFMPWITLTDEVGAILHLLDRPDVTGPVNLSALEPGASARHRQGPRPGAAPARRAAGAVVRAARRRSASSPARSSAASASWVTSCATAGTPSPTPTWSRPSAGSSPDLAAPVPTYARPGSPVNGPAGPLTSARPSR